MKKTMTAIIAATALSASSAFAATYNLVTNDDNAVDYSRVTGIDVKVSSGSTKVTNDPAPLPVSGQWTFDFSGGNTVDFTGVIEMNKLAQYNSITNVSVPIFGSMSGTITYEGAFHTIAGTGSWDADTRTLTYSLPSGGANSSIGSVYQETSSSCSGSGSVLGNSVCGTWQNTTPEWEGFNLELTFSANMDSFTGVLKAIEQSGSGLTANTTTTTFELVGEVPVPAAAWLFGSGLVGLAGIARRRRNEK